MIFGNYISLSSIMPKFYACHPCIPHSLAPNPYKHKSALPIRSPRHRRPSIMEAHLNPQNSQTPSLTSWDPAYQSQTPHRADLTILFAHKHKYSSPAKCGQCTRLMLQIDHPTFFDRSHFVCVRQTDSKSSYFHSESVFV